MTDDEMYGGVTELSPIWDLNGGWIIGQCKQYLCLFACVVENSNIRKLRSSTRQILPPQQQWPTRHIYICTITTASIPLIGSNFLRRELFDEQQHSYETYNTFNSVNMTSLHFSLTFLVLDHTQGRGS
jgi:hypothetical protein